MTVLLLCSVHFTLLHEPRISTSVCVFPSPLFYECMRVSNAMVAVRVRKKKEKTKKKKGRKAKKKSIHIS